MVSGQAGALDRATEGPPIGNRPRRPVKRQSVLPEASEPVRGKLSVTHRMLDIFVAEVVLQRSGIDPLVCQLEAAGMAQHVRMHAKCHLGGLTEPLQHAAKADWAHGCPALAHEHVAALLLLALQPA